MLQANETPREVTQQQNPAQALFRYLQRVVYSRLSLDPIYLNEYWRPVVPVVNDRFEPTIQHSYFSLHFPQLSLYANDTPSCGSCFRISAANSPKSCTVSATRN